jgi:hypothetical protein
MTTAHGDAALVAVIHLGGLTAGTAYPQAISLRQLRHADDIAVL